MNNIKEINKSLVEFNTKLATLKEDMATKYSVLLLETFTPFLTKYPTVHSIFWTQYTPYFMDGDPCTFGKNELYLILDEDEDPDGYEGSEIPDASDVEYMEGQLIQATLYRDSPRKWREEYGHIDAWRDYPYYQVEFCLERISYIKKFMSATGSSTLKKDFEELSHIFYQFEDEVLEVLYGDHVKVSITRDGIQTDEYEHD